MMNQAITDSMCDEQTIIRPQISADDLMWSSEDTEREWNAAKEKEAQDRAFLIEEPAIEWQTGSGVYYCAFIRNVCRGDAAFSEWR